MALRRSPLEFMGRYANSMLHAQLGKSKLVKPLVASLYITTKCNFRCTYCDDGSGNMYPEIPEQTKMETAAAMRVLEIMRRACPGMNVTGGEPTLRADIDDLYDYIGELDYFPVTFNTNAFLLDQHLRVLKNTDYLVVSLDAVDAAQADALINVGSGGQTARVLRNLERAERYRVDEGLAFQIIVNTVILPETIDDAWDVWEYCLARGHLWSPMPHIVGKYPNPGLVDNPRWTALIDEVIRAKKAGARIFGYGTTLRAIRDFSRFECFPTTRPIIYPNGDLFYPCSPLGTIAANLLETGDYDRAVQMGLDKHGPIPHCDARCHLSCYMEPSNCLSHPEEAILDALRDAFWPAKTTPRIQRPTRVASAPPPKLHDIRELPSMPAAELRALRAAGKLANDFTSFLRMKSDRRGLRVVG